MDQIHRQLHQQVTQMHQQVTQMHQHIHEAFAKPTQQINKILHEQHQQMMQIPQQVTQMHQQLHQQIYKAFAKPTQQINKIWHEQHQQVMQIPQHITQLHQQIQKVFAKPTQQINNILHEQIRDEGLKSIGVCNGGLGNNLPSDQETVELYKSNGITRMRIYSPKQSTLEALRGSKIELILDVPNHELQRLGTDSSAANKWVQNNVLKYYPSVMIKYIAVGNEVNPNGGDTSWLTRYVLPAMLNVYNAIAAASLKDKIKVSTATYMALLSNSYPPSHGSFEGSSKKFMEAIISFLVRTNAPLLANIYPYFAYIANPRDIQLSYALFTTGVVVVWDGRNGYTNLFDAMLDAFYSAVEKAGGSGVEIVISETGWPSNGGFAASIENASTYLKNLINHVKGGTPKRPSKRIEAYVFAMYDENQKNGAETEKHFGVFSPNKQPKYHISFS